jgi:hypothetical protein
MFGSATRTLDNRVHLERVESWTRERFGLSPRDIVLVREERVRTPGFLSPQTTVLFWVGPARHRFVIFAPVSEVHENDLPVAWLRPALIDDGDNCC